jgi:hypothetical protein
MTIQRLIESLRSMAPCLVQTDLFKKNFRNFNKDAAINQGFGHFQYHGWRMHLDSDIVLPPNFRRILFNHTELDRNCIYGMDRIDVIGADELERIFLRDPQHGSFLVNPQHPRAISPRYVDPLRGYVPIGYFQLWHAASQKPYPYSLGSAAHDDVLFASQWSRKHRHVVPTGLCYHLVSTPPKIGENWDGKRRQPRWEKKKK